MAIKIVFTLLSSILLIYVQIVFLVVIISYFRKKVTFDQYILPLDEIDGRKLYEMVKEQIDLYIKPAMTAKGYTEEQIKEILTSKPVGIRTLFRR